MKPSILPSSRITIPIFFGLFFGGGFVGIQLSEAIAPGSGLAEFVSFLTLPAGFISGIVFWAGSAIPGAIRRFIQLASKRDRSSKVRANDPGISIPPGTFAIVPAALIPSAISGFIVAVISTNSGFSWVLFVYTAIGLLYGFICWRLARAGYLPFPTE